MFPNQMQIAVWNVVISSTTSKIFQDQRDSVEVFIWGLTPQSLLPLTVLFASQLATLVVVAAAKLPRRLLMLWFSWPENIIWDLLTLPLFCKKESKVLSKGVPVGLASLVRQQIKGKPPLFPNLLVSPLCSQSNIIWAGPIYIPFQETSLKSITTITISSSSCPDFSIHILSQHCCFILGWQVSSSNAWTGFLSSEFLWDLCV